MLSLTNLKEKLQSYVAEASKHKVTDSKYYDCRKDYICLKMEFDTDNTSIVGYGQEFDKLVELY